MSLRVEEETTDTIVGTKEMTDVNKKKKTLGEEIFNTSVTIIIAAWLGLIVLAFSVRKYNI